MGKKKCEDEKKKADSTFNAKSDYFINTVYDAKEAVIEKAEIWYKSCDTERLKRFSGDKLVAAQNACDEAREDCGKAITHFKEVSTQYKKLEEEDDKAEKALSDCEHKKKKGKK